MIFRVFILSIAIWGLVACKMDKEKMSTQSIKDLYMEPVGFPSNMEEQFMDYFLIQHSIDSMVFDFGNGEGFTTRYRFRDAAELPDSNLLDGTRKFRITLLPQSVDTIRYQVESYKSEMSKWKRVGNSGNHLVYSDSLPLDLLEIGDQIAKSIHIYVYKFLP